MQGSLTTNSSGTSSGEVGEVPVGWTFVLFFLPAICTGDFELVGGYSSKFRREQLLSKFSSYQVNEFSQIRFGVKMKWVCSVNCHTTKHSSPLTKLHKEQEECLVV